MAAIAIEASPLDRPTFLSGQHDALTELPNRLLLEDRPAASCGLREPSRSGLAVLLLDLDGFKYVNDTLGHQAGDQVLVEVSCRLRSVIRQADTLARVGGDEFCLVLSDVRKVNDALKIPRPALDSCASYFIAGRDLLAERQHRHQLLPEHGVEPAALQQHADTAECTMPSSTARMDFRSYFGDQCPTRERLELMGDLRQALDNGEFFG